MPVFVALQITLARAADEPTHPTLSPGLKVGAAAVIGTPGVLDLGWNTHALLVLLLAGLAVPMASHPVAGPDLGGSGPVAAGPAG